MAINRAQLVKELVPGLNALFGLEYDQYPDEHAEIFDTESSDRAFEEEVMLSGFGEAPVKGEGAAVVYDYAQETFTARYTHETIALAFSLTEEAMEDNLYDSLSARYTRALARSMHQTKQVKAANVLNNGFTAGASAGGDGKALMATDHPTYSVNHYLTDSDAWFLTTDVPNGLKHFVRTPVSSGMEGDFESGNVRYKARERYSFGFSDWRGIYGSPGA
jgi:hypothetical protein